MIGSRVPTRETGHMRSTCWNLKSFWQVGFCESFATQSKSQVPTKLSTWLFWLCLFTFLYQHYKNPHYPRNVRRARSLYKKLLREKTLAKHLRVRDCLPTILYIISLEFPLLLPFHLHILERFLAQTFISSILSVERSFGAYGKHWKKPLSGRCNWAELRDPDN